MIKLIDFGLSKILGNIEIMNIDNIENTVEMQTKTGSVKYQYFFFLKYNIIKRDSL